MNPFLARLSTTVYSEPQLNFTSWSLPRSRSMVATSYGCIGRSRNADSSGNASRFPTLRRLPTDLTPPPVTRQRVYGTECQPDQPSPENRADPTPSDRLKRKPDDQFASIRGIRGALECRAGATCGRDTPVKGVSRPQVSGLGVRASSRLPIVMITTLGNLVKWDNRERDPRQASRADFIL